MSAVVAEWKTAEEQAVREEIVELRKARVLSEEFVFGKVKGGKDESPVECSLELGLRCLILQLSLGGIITEDEKNRLINRVNVLLRAHPPAGIPLQVLQNP